MERWKMSTIRVSQEGSRPDAVRKSRPVWIELVSSHLQVLYS